MEGISKAIGIVVIAMMVTALAAAVLTIPVYYLWNWLMPEVFGLTTLTFWQALGISLLSGCLFQRGSSSKSSS